jgi:hypothetical protein
MAVAELALATGISRQHNFIRLQIELQRFCLQDSLG